ncbi:roadblock/LC7 domain-containing protein [Catenulispora pinisilvae]|uniref:roadblock/LC7 domain-containing protein n=1 Tax=Catenulispora pinisilvae TaxID=2705253 RepID=UPI002B26A9D2|nr:roadblock/LC7 domain-containing protein [Catenulispora pinisilvae]
MTSTATPGRSELGWLLDELSTRVPMIRHAVVLSADGLAVATSAKISREDGEHLAAVASGLHSLAKGATRHFGSGPVRQTMIEFDQGFLFVVAAGGGACLAVFSDAGADVGLIAYEMARTVRRVGEHLTAPPRSAAAGEPAGEASEYPSRTPDGMGAPPA